MATTWRSTLLYPAVIPIDDPGYAHGTFVSMSEFTPVLLPELPGGTFQGTIYHFDTTNFATHHGRAWRTVGWESIRFVGNIQIPNDLIRLDNNTSALSPVIAFDYTFNNSIGGKNIHDSAKMVAPDTSPVAHAGTNPVDPGALVTNTNMNNTLGEWEVSGLNASTWSEVGSQIVGYVDQYDSGGDPPITSVGVLFTLFAKVRGNSSILRYLDGSTWHYVSIFWLTLKGDLSTPDAVSGGVFEAPDGSHSPTVSATLNASPAVTSTDITVVSGNSGNTPVGAVDVGSVYGFSSDPELFEYEATGTEANNHAVPWLVTDTTLSMFELALWSDVAITINDPLYSVLPAAL